MCNIKYLGGTMVKKVNNMSHYLRKGTSTNEARLKKMNEIINIIGGEPTQYTQVMDMCVDYVLKILRANPSEMENMEKKKKKKKTYSELDNTKAIIIEPTFDEREMLQFLKKKTFIKNYADLYSYALSCVAEIEKNMEVKP